MHRFIQQQNRILCTSLTFLLISALVDCVEFFHSQFKNWLFWTPLEYLNLTPFQYIDYITLLTKYFADYFSGDFLLDNLSIKVVINKSIRFDTNVKTLYTKYLNYDINVASNDNHLRCIQKNLEHFGTLYHYILWLVALIWLFESNKWSKMKRKIARLLQELVDNYLLFKNQYLTKLCFNVTDFVQYNIYDWR